MEWLMGGTLTSRSLSSMNHVAFVILWVMLTGRLSAADAPAFACAPCAEENSTEAAAMREAALLFHPARAPLAPSNSPLVSPSPCFCRDRGWNVSFPIQQLQQGVRAIPVASLDFEIDRMSISYIFVMTCGQHKGPHAE